MALEEQIEEVEERFKLETPAELVPEWAESRLYAKEHPLVLGLETADEVLDGDLRSKVIAITGLAGSKKSLLGAQCCNINSKVYQARGIISNMEMSNTQQLNRLLDFGMEPFEPYNNAFKINASKHYKDELTRDNQELIVSQLQQSMFEFYGDHLLINDKSNMTVEDYDQLIQTGIDKYEYIDILLVDGMSMTGESGGENERYSKMSAGLKMLAKKYNVLIAVICHLSKVSGGRAITATTRDQRPWVRGSQKIIDDLDICICLSAVNINNDPNQFDPSLGYFWMYDKRGSGQTVKLVTEFHPNRLLISQSSIDPDSVEIQEEEKDGGF
jgi:replicative DNA helicase